MKTLNQRVYFLTFITFFVISGFLSPPTTAQEVEDESEFDYKRGSKKGPDRWGDIKKEWAACKNGAMQSPIDLSTKTVKVFKNLGNVKTNYKPSSAIIMNRGHDISIKWVGNPGSMKINGSHYRLQQAHWHSPSEHTINGRRFDMELHLVHKASNPDVKYPIAVIAIFYKIGPPDPFLSKLTKKIKKMGDQKAERDGGKIDPRKIKMRGRKYYRYMGSLTVPPCTQGVIWNINHKVGTVSRKQVKLLRWAVHDDAEKNARPIQRLNSRQIEFYDPNPNPRQQMLH